MSDKKRQLTDKNTLKSAESYPALMSREKGRAGRPKGTGEYPDRLTLRLPIELIDKLRLQAKDSDISTSALVRRIVERDLELQQELGHTRIVVTVAPKDLEDLRKAIRNGYAPPIEIATSEAVRRYLEWLRLEAEQRKAAFGNV